MPNLTKNSVCGIQYTSYFTSIYDEACEFDLTNTSFVCSLAGNYPDIYNFSICCSGANISGDIIYFPNAAFGQNSLAVNFSNNFPSTLTNLNPQKYTIIFQVHKVYQLFQLTGLLLQQ